MTHLTQLWECQIIDCLQFETRPCCLHNVRVAKSTWFLFSIALSAIRFTHRQPLTAYFFVRYFFIRC